MNLTHPSDLNALLLRHGFHLKKALGQNFLADENILAGIIQCIGLTGQETVLEIGPGVGTLTQQLCRHAKRVVAVEMDELLLPLLAETLEEYGNCRVLRGDILRLNLVKLVQEELGGEFVLAANLPYYITTPVLMEFIAQGLPMRRAVVMVQKEAAQRFVAKPSTKAYGVPSVIAQAFAHCHIALRVPPGAFMPPPKVDSAVLVMDFEQTPSQNEVVSLLRITRAAFAMRRKTLENNLHAGLCLTREQARAVIAQCGLPPQVRAEQLDVSLFFALEKAINSIGR